MGNDMTKICVIRAESVKENKRVGSSLTLRETVLSYVSNLKCISSTVGELPIGKEKILLTSDFENNGKMSLKMGVDQELAQKTVQKVQKCQ
ncbi:hypothetical protein NQ318_018973 [Aromia moschata]|uniref:Uncharacterized protein n=1 Tax=Aromia moschata TaxID=1265417 RepID=A0AAV8Y732_9CUCU|nr:hypothetical protein NQ318_018973 [Aromia moschata]